MQVPGTVNRKNFKMSRVLEADWSLSYNLSDFKPYLLEASPPPNVR